MISTIYEAVTGRYTPHGNPTRAEVILAPAFGRDSDSVGLSNEAIALFAVEHAQRKGIGIIAQYSVANAIVRRFRRGDLLEARIDPINEKDAYYISSGRMLERSAVLIGSRTTLLAAHAFHAPRFDAQAIRNGIDTVLPPGLPTEWDPANLPQESHCNSAVRWAMREPFVIAHHLATGKI